MKAIHRCTLACATMAALAACGGGDELPKAELGKRASAICEKYSKEGRKLGSPELTDPKKAAEYFSKAEALSQKQQNELEGLEPASEVEDDYEKLTTATDEATTLLGDLSSAAESNDKQKGGELLQKLPDVSSKVSSAAKAVGADNCAG